MEGYKKIQKFIFHWNNQLNQLIINTDNFRESNKVMEKLLKEFYNNVDMKKWINPNLPENKVINLMIPNLILKAFSCELMIKSILKIHNTETKGHNLHLLFKKIPKELQKTVISNISKLNE